MSLYEILSIVTSAVTLFLVVGSKFERKASKVEVEKVAIQLAGDREVNAARMDKQDNLLVDIKLNVQKINGSVGRHENQVTDHEQRLRNLEGTGSHRIHKRE